MRAWASFTAVVLGCVFLTSSTCYGATIYACMKKAGGAVRIVSATAKCTALERKMSWSDAAETATLKGQDAILQARDATLQAQMADRAPAAHLHDDRYYTTAEVDALTSGLTAVVVGPTGWVRNGWPGDGTLDYWTNEFRINTTGAASVEVMTSPQVVAQLNGRVMKVIGVRICASGSPEQYIDLASLEVQASDVTLVAFKQDHTDRTTSGCFMVNLDTPVELTTDRFVSLWLSTKALAAGRVEIFGTTFYFE